MTSLAQLSDKALGRLYRRLHGRITSGQGYQPFGFDMRTLRLTRPGLANSLLQVNFEILSRPSMIEVNSR